MLRVPQRESNAAEAAAGAAHSIGGNNAASRVVDEVEKILKPPQSTKSEYLDKESEN